METADIDTHTNIYTSIYKLHMHTYMGPMYRSFAALHDEQ